MYSFLLHFRSFIAPFLCAVAFGAFNTPALAAPDRDLDVTVQIVGDEIHAQASLFVRAPLERVWDVVTDYERAPEYTRDLQISRVLSRTGDTLRLLQKGKVRFGPFAVPVETVRDIRLIPPTRAEARLVGGSMKKYDSTTELVREAGGTRIIMRSQAIPDSAFSGFIGESMVKRETEDRFRQLRAEILRREHLAAGQ
jgi:hypothetical protein